MLRELVREVRRFRPHILHAHHFEENAVAPWIRLAGLVPCYVIGRHYSDQIHVWAGGWKRAAFVALENFANRRADRIVVQTPRVAEILTDWQGIDPDKIEVLTHGMDFDRLRVSSPDAAARLRREEGLEGQFVILFCGRLIWIKAIDVLLEAMATLSARHPDVRLVIAGAGPQEDELKRQARNLGIDSVTRFLGWRHDVADWMATADVLVNPSLTESFPQVLIEALAVGTPVIMTPVGSAPEIIGDQQRGRLVPVRDAGAIVRAVEELHRNPDLGPRLAHAGAEWVRDRYQSSAMVRRYEHLYERLAEG